MIDFDMLVTLRAFLIVDAVLLAICLPVGLLLRWVLRRISPSPPGLDRSASRRFGAGAILAVLVLVGTVAPAALAGGYRAGPGWQAYPAAGESLGVGLTWLFFAAQALLEELLFRGVAMALIAAALLALVRLLVNRHADDPEAGPLLWAWFGTGVFVNLLVAIPFGLVHANNPNATPVALVNVILVSLVLGHLLWSQASVLGAWALHWVWNASVVTLGFPISGVRFPPPLDDIGVSGARGGPLTGGQFGPEGSLPCTVVLAIVLAIMLFDTIRAVRTATAASRVVFEQDTHVV
jgi:membrane protease YdiL (CAAX protease family)